MLAELERTLLCADDSQRLQEMVTARVTAAPPTAVAAAVSSAPDEAAAAAAAAAGGAATPPQSAPPGTAPAQDIIDQTLNRVLVVKAHTPDELKHWLNQLTNMVCVRACVRGSVCVGAWFCVCVVVEHSMTPKLRLLTGSY